MSTNFRSPMYDEPRIFSGSYPMNTPAGTYNTMPPPLPPRPYNNTYQTNYNPYNSFGSSGFSGYGNTFGNAYGMYGVGYGNASMYGTGFNRYGNNGPENR